MKQVFASSWALLLGMCLLMVGNGIQGTLLGIRGGAEGFSTFQMSIVMSAYFFGFLFGSRMTPEMIRRVGHVRVFAALASLVSAVLILYPALVHPAAWIFGRVIVGFCFSGIYVTAEGWLNNSVTNENRGKALSLYMVVQMVGVIAAQGFLAVGDASGFIPFIIPSVLVSIAFAPILLSVQPTPAYDTIKPMPMTELFKSSPLGMIGMFLLGLIFSAQFGMSSVFGTERGLSVEEISIFAASFYVGGLLFQMPVGFAADRMDRRSLIVLMSLIGAIGGFVGMAFGGTYWFLIVAAVMSGAASNPLYALLIAHTNDYLEHEDMASASGALVFVSGVGAISGPIVTGWLMTVFGAGAYFLILVMPMAILCAYTLYRMTRRAAVSVDDTGIYTPILPSATYVALDVATEMAIEADELQEEQDASTN